MCILERAVVVFLAFHGLKLDEGTRALSEELVVVRGQGLFLESNRHNPYPNLWFSV